MHGQRAEVYGTLASITHDAEHIVIARVVNQSGQPPNYDLLPITQSTIEVVEVLKGKWAPGDQRTIFDIGNSTVLMDHTAAPVKVGTTYLLFLVSMGKWDKRDGKAIDGKNIFTSVLPAHFYVAGDTYTLDEPSIPDTVPRTFTRAELQAVLKKK